MGVLHASRKLRIVFLKIVKIVFLGKSDMKFEISVEIEVVDRDVQIYCDFLYKEYGNT